MSLAKKLRIKAGAKIIVLNAPVDYKAILGPLPEDVSISNKLSKEHDFIQLFVQNKAELEKSMDKAVNALAQGGLIWVTYPKQSSGIQTDLTRDKGWESLQQYDMEWLSLVAFNENWSAFLMRNNPAKWKPSFTEKYEAAATEWYDPKTKTVVVPDDLAIAFKTNKEAKARFESYAYSHRKEYVVWITSAKREETRQNRVVKTIEMLLAGKKNPTDK